VPFIEAENYHLFTRGTDKQIVFRSKDDYERFMILLLLCNSLDGVKFENLLKKYRGLPSLQIFKNEKSAETLVDIIAYALMPNHIHLIVHEKKSGGISKFMLKLMTAYSMYFNKKYERSGPLFTRPFRSRHIDSDEYFRWVFAYVLLNPLELVEGNWKERGVVNASRAGEFLRTYLYSSYPDYLQEQRPESQIISRGVLPLDVSTLRTLDDVFELLSANDHAQPTTS
jgi:putative transposase